MTKNKKHVYGDHETQMSEGGEADLHKHLVSCKKNPGHTNFIPVDKFTMSLLPENYHNKDVYEYIKATADLTVRVDVKMTSPHRPEFWPNTKISYPFFEMRDKTNLRYGSGVISMEVYKFIDGYSDRYGRKHWKGFIKCWCKKCRNSDTSSHMWWEFFVFTATHVVFDATEAYHTSLTLFYDTVESAVVNVGQLMVVDVGTESDVCKLTFATCDANLGNKLNILCENYETVWEKVCDKYKHSSNINKLTFIVSHPHGCSKHVTFGHWIDKFKLVEFDLYRFHYTTCTCPGSSGGPVQFVGHVEGWWWRQPVHSEVYIRN